MLDRAVDKGGRVGIGLRVGSRGLQCGGVDLLEFLLPLNYKCLGQSWIQDYKSGSGYIYIYIYMRRYVV